MRKQSVGRQISQIMSITRFSTAVWLGAGWMGAMAIAPSELMTAAQAASLSNWAFDPATRQLEVTVPAGTTPRFFLVAEPARIVLEIPNAEIGSVPMQQAYSAGAVRQIRLSQFQSNVSRIVIEMAPDAVFAPGQAELKRVGSGNGGDRWVLRPLLAGDSPTTPAIASAPTPVPNPTIAAAPPPAPLPSTAPTPSMPFPGLPPLESDAQEIPVDPPATRSSAPSVPSPVSAQPANSASPAERPADQRLALPPPDVAQAAGEPPTPSETINVPSLESVPQPEASPQPPLAPQRPATLPTIAPEASPQVTPEETPGTTSIPVPAPDSPAPAPSAPVTAPPANPTPADNQIEFGQPLPLQSSLLPTSLSATTADASIPPGTVLSLRYPGSEPLQLTADEARQEVLILQEAVFDRTGNVLFPADSEVIGRFETSSKGSQFVVQAISWQGQSLLVSGESEPLEGNRRVPRNRLFRNSGLGAVVGTVLGAVTGVGLLAAVAAGAASSAAGTYLAAPQPAVIEPNQILQVQILQVQAQAEEPQIGESGLQ